MPNTPGAHRPSGRSLRSKILLLILLAFAPAVVLNLVAGWEYRREAIEEAKQDTLALVRVAARDHDELIFRTTPLLLRTLAELYPEVRAQDGPRTSALFVRVLAQYPHYNNMLAARAPTGEVFGAGSFLSKPVSISDRPVFRRVLETRRYAVGEFAIGKASGKPTLVCAYPVLGDHGQVQSVIATGINLERLATQLADSRQPKELGITLFDRNGTVLLATWAHRAWAGRDASASAVWRAIQSKKAEGIYRGPSMDGIRKLVAFKPLVGPDGEPEAYVAATIPEDVALASANRFLRHSLIGFAASTGVVLLGLLLIGRRSILRGVESLVATADLLAAGDLRARTRDVGDTEEFQRLGRAFDTMAESLLAREEEQRSAERALFEEKEQLAVTLRSIGDGVITTDGDGRVLLLNGMAEALTGWAHGEAVGKPLGEVFQIVNEKTRQPCPNPAERVLETGAVVALANHTALIARDGRERIIADSAAPIRGPDDRTIGVVLVFRDETEKRRSQEQLAESEARYRALVENIDLGITLVDTDYRIVMTNSALAALRGQEPSDLVGKRCFSAFEGQDGPCPHCPGTRAMASGQPARVETRVVRPDGTAVALRMQAYPVLESPGTVKGFIEVVEDITKQKEAEAERAKLEQKMLQAQKLESLGVLAGGIAHDFNNLLVGILGNVDLALQGLLPESRIGTYLQKIEGAALRAADLTNQMLAYSGKGRFLVEPVDLSQLVREMGHLLETVISKTAVVRYELSSDLPLIEADATQVRQVVMNLITNASDALGDREGNITVTTGAVEADGSYLAATHLGESLPEGTYVYVEVADTGCGIDGETRGKIFDPFFTTKEAGRGLGLAAVLGIVRGHRGALKVYGEPGLGTTFRVYFPASGSGSERPETRGEHEPGVDTGLPFRGTILVVDDEEVVTSVAKEMLEGEGFTVLTASDGIAGLEVFRAHAPEIVAVVLDMTMPRMGGEEAFREMRKIRADVPVILSSGYNEQDTVGRFAEAGLTGFVQKPYRVRTLLDKLNETIGRGLAARGGSRP